MGCFMRIGDIVEVLWDDTASDDAWKDAGDPELPLVECRTVGYYRSEDKRAIYLTDTTSNDEGRFNAVTIPRGCIRKMRRLS